MHALHNSQFQINNNQRKSTCTHDPIVLITFEKISKLCSNTT